jgi:catechol 2,3-dioxygenase-like lactoylglutathione lyase family enzyme
MLGSENIMAFVATQNPQRAKKFYRDTLGLDLIGEDRFALTFDVSGVMLRVTTVQEIVLVPYTVLGWRIADIRSKIEELVSRGIVFERYGHFEQDDLGVWQAPGGAQIAWFKDPDGNTLSLAQM